MSDLESPWKELAEELPQRVLHFFFPDIHDDLDWTRDVESLEQEMRKLHPQAEVGKRIVDKLLKAYRRKTGDPRYLHLEIQGQREGEFPRRVYVYNYRAEDRWGQPVASLVLLIDDDEKWHPKQYESEVYGCKKHLTFRTRKILDWRGREAELESDPNPVGLFVLAHLEARRTREDPEERAAVKLRLTLRLHERGMQGEEVRLWYRFLDWLLELPPEYDRKILADIQRYEEDKHMPFITFAERQGIEKGLEQGLEKGLEQGLEKGLQKGLEQGQEKGRAEARREYLLKGIALGVELKFGAEGLALMPDIEKQEKLDVLEAVFNHIKNAASSDDLKRLWS